MQRIFPNWILFMQYCKDNSQIGFSFCNDAKHFSKLDFAFAMHSIGSETFQSNAPGIPKSGMWQFAVHF